MIVLNSTVKFWVPGFVALVAGIAVTHLYFPAFPENPALFLRNWFLDIAAGTIAMTVVYASLRGLFNFVDSKENSGEAE